MSKTLSNILTVFKVVRVIAKVVFILCIIGAVGCAIGLFSLRAVGNNLPPFIISENILSLPSVYAACISGLIACVGEAILAFLSERYFVNVLSAGTPFTMEGSKELFRLGVTSIIISAAISVASGFVFAICAYFSADLSSFDFNASISISTGLFFMFLSLIFKHGAELRVQEEPSTNSETL